MTILRNALLGFRRSPLLSGLSVAAVGFSLFVVGLFGLTAHNIDRAIESVEEQVEVVAYLREDTGETRAEIARKEIEALPEVREVRYVSKVEALHEASRELVEFSDVFSDLEVNPLPASLEILLAPAHRGSRQVQEIADRVAGYDFVEEVRYGREWVERVFTLRRIAGAAAAVLGGAFALAAVLLTGTAVRMAILARSRAIEIMRTVGATESYVRRPYLLEGLFTGLAGGLLALGLTWLTYWTVDTRLLRLAWIPDSWVLLGLGGAGLLGVVAAWRAVRRELRGLYEL